MLRNFKYFINQGFRNFAKNGAMSVASVIIITACLALFGIYIVFGINVNYIGDQFQSQFQIDVYIDRAAGEAKTQDIGDVLAKMKNVESIEYVSKKEAFKKLEEMFSDNPEATVGYDAENLNPLMASYRITLDELSNVSAVKAEVEKIDGVHHVNSKDDAMKTMLSSVKMARTVSLWIMLILAIISILIISNAIKMTVFARRKEINIMKFIGATDSFIRSPFIVEGIIIGFIGAIIAMAIITPLYGYISAMIIKLVRGMIRLKSISEVLPMMACTFLVFGGALGAIGSWVSIKKHLKV